jgi:uncharacterized membrane protein
MIQVSLIGYMSAGSFLGLQYFDLFYHLIVIIVVVHVLVQRAIGQIAEPQVQADLTSAAGLERAVSSADPMSSDKSQAPRPGVVSARFADSRLHR